jgi:hypothetical protein
MVLPKARLMPVKLLSLAMKESFGEGTIRTLVKELSEHLEEKNAANPPSWRANCWCFLHQQEQGGPDCAF